MWPLLFWLLIFAPCGKAQEPIRTSSELVKLDVTVLDSKGQFVAGLNRSDFHILDNGAEKPVAFSSPVDEPEQVLIVIETSPAVYLIHDQHLFALSALLDGLDPGDEAALIGYDESPYEIVPFTSDKKALLAAVSDAQFRIGMGDLWFYDSIRSVLDQFADTQGKKALVLLTTGLDSSPPDHWDALQTKLRQEDVVIYSVGLGGPLRGDASEQPKKTKKKTKHHAETPNSGSIGQMAFAQADKALLAIAHITGGRTYFPQSADDFEPAYREIASALRHEYVIGISPEHDGTFHKLTIEIPGGHDEKGNANFRAFSREGYLAPTR